MRQFFRKIRTEVSVFVFFVVLSCALTYPFALHLADHLRDNGDSYEYAWDIGFGAYQLAHDPLHLYSGNIFYPFPLSLAYSDSTVPNIVLGAPVVWLTNNPVLALNILILLTFVLGGYGMYLFVRQRTGSRAAGIVAGILYGFSPFRFDHLAQLPNVSMEWAPFALWSLDRYLASGRSRWAAGFALFCVLQVLVSFYYAFILGFGIAIYFVARLIQLGRSWMRPRLILPFVASCAVGALVAAPFIIPYFTVERVFGLQRTLDEAIYFSAWPANFLAANRTSVVVLIAPLVRAWLHFWPKSQIAASERWLYPGLLIVLLAAVAVARRPKSVVIAPACMVIAGILLSFGPVFHIAANVSVPLPIPMPYAILFHYLPGFTALRVPSRFGALVVFGLAILAGDGLAYLETRLDRSGKPLAHLSTQPISLRHLLVAGCATVAIVEGATILPLTPVKVGKSVPPVYQWLATNPEPGAVVELPIDDNAFHESPRSYYSTYDHRPLVNGFRSFIPPLYNDLANSINLFPSVEAISTLERLGIRFVVVHRAELTPSAQERLSLLKNVPGIQLATQFGPDEVFRVTGQTQPESIELTLRQSGCIDTSTSQGTTTSIATLNGSGRFIVLAPRTHSLSFQISWQTANRTVLQEVVQTPVGASVIASPLSIPVTYKTPAQAGVYTLIVTLVGQPGLQARAAVPYVLDSQVPNATTVGHPHLLAAKIDSPRPEPTTAVDYTLAWQMPRSVPGPLVVFVNAYDVHHTYWSFPRGTEPHFPGPGTCGGDLTLDNDSLPLRPHIPPGQYWVETGLLDPATGQRVPFVGPDGKTITDFVVGSFWIRPTNVFPTIGATGSNNDTYNFGGFVDLRQATVSGAAAPNGEIEVKAWWDTKTRTTTNYTLFVHVLDSSGKLVAQYDGQPTGGVYPTSAWLPGESILDHYAVKLPANLSPGTYQVDIGLYNLKTLGRLPVTTKVGEKPTDQVSLGTISYRNGN